MKNSDLEVEIRNEGTRAIIEGKTTVAFRAFVQLILQRKVAGLVRDAGDEAVIVSSELLTKLASAPQDSQENRAQLVIVTLAVGTCIGIFVTAALHVLLLSSGVLPTMREYLVVVGSFAAVALIGWLMSRVRRRNRSQKIADVMEGIASMVSK